MSKIERRGRQGTWPKFFGVAAAMAAATFLSGLGYSPDAHAAATGSGGHQIAGGTDGIYHSPVLNYPVPATFDGTSINWVSGAFDDDGPVSGDWDANFWASGGAFTLFVVDEYNNAVVVSGTEVALLQPGATIGPDSTFSDTGTSVDAAADWLAGADGYIGFRFDCDGRLAAPVSGVCYGYVHVTTTAPDGFPATIVEYAYDINGNPISIGPVETFTVTPSVGTPSGTITPATPQTVNSGATTQFTLAADPGFHIDTVGGTCGGNLAGSVYTTAAVTADCTVIANFAVGEADPAISATPSPLAISVDAGASGTGTVTVKNTGGGTLTYSIAEAPTTKATSYLTERRALRYAKQRSAAAPIGSFARSLRTNGGGSVKSHGKPVVLDDLSISQMQDNTPVALSGVSCPQAANSWWRRFYFSEHPGVGATANVASVTIASETDAGAPMPLTINLYTIAHSTAVDTIPAGDLTLIGSATGTIEGELQTITIPVTGTVDDTAGKDLVVEWHIDNADALDFYPGANGTPETHPTFLSSEACGTPDPTPAANVGPGFPDFHLVMVVTLGDGGPPPASCDNPSDVPWLSVAPATGSLAGGASADSTVTVDASTLAAGSYSANLCVTSNDTVNPLVTIPVNVTVAAVPPGDPCSAADTIFCDGFDGSAGSDDIVSGTIDQAWVQDDGNGSSFNFATGSFHAYDGSATDDDINLYYLESGGSTDPRPGMFVYWYGDAVPDGTTVGGVVDSGGVDFAVLHSGDSIGPDSAIAGTSQNMANWIGGADGYIGIAFYNESTSAVNYGYIHVTTTAPLGYPAQALEWAYDKTGAAITIP